MERSEKMRQIRDEVMGLVDSPLYEYRQSSGYFPVIGEGSHTAKIMFIGEAPGRNEAKTGRPFCGAAGKILDELLNGVGIKREDVYITNIVKDRPPENRDPTQDEIRSYGPFLDRQIEIIRPEVIATLGRYSMGYIMEHFNLTQYLGPIGKLHGRTFDATAPYGSIKIAVLYHPAVAVYNSNTKNDLMKDFTILRDLG